MTDFYQQYRLIRMDDGAREKLRGLGLDADLLEKILYDGMIDGIEAPNLHGVLEPLAGEDFFLSVEETSTLTAEGMAAGKTFEFETDTALAYRLIPAICPWAQQLTPQLIDEAEAETSMFQIAYKLGGGRSVLEIEKSRVKKEIDKIRGRLLNVDFTQFIIPVVFLWTLRAEQAAAGLEELWGDLNRFETGADILCRQETSMKHDLRNRYVRRFLESPFALFGRLPQRFQPDFEHFDRLKWVPSSDIEYARNFVAMSEQSVNVEYARRVADYLMDQALQLTPENRKEYEDLVYPADR